MPREGLLPAPLPDLLREGSPAAIPDSPEEATAAEPVAPKKRARKTAARKPSARALAQRAPERVFEALSAHLTREQDPHAGHPEGLQQTGSDPIDTTSTEPPSSSIASSEAHGLPAAPGRLSEEEMAHFNAWFDECMDERAAIRGEVLDMEQQPAWQPQATARSSAREGMLLLSGGMRSASDEESVKDLRGWKRWSWRLRPILKWAERRPMLSSFIASATFVCLALSLPSLFDAGEASKKPAPATAPSPSASTDLETRVKQLQMENIVLHRLAVSTADMALLMGKRLEEAGFKGLDEGMAQAIGSLKSMPKPELNAQLKQEMAEALGQKSSPAPAGSASRPQKPAAKAGWQRRPAASSAAPSIAPDPAQGVPKSAEAELPPKPPAPSQSDGA